MALEPKQILETTNVTATLNSGIPVQVGPGTGTPSGHKTISQIRDIITNSTSRNVYWVDELSGNDTTGTGSVLAPWATVSHALSQLTASGTIFYTIMISGIIVDPNQIMLKPNVNIRGFTQGSTITSSFPIILDPSFNTILNQGPYLENLQITNDFDYDASFVTSGSQPFLQLNGVTVYGNFTVQGSAVNNVVPYFFSYYSFVQGTAKIVNCTHTSFIDEFGSLTINDTSGSYISLDVSSLILGSSYLSTTMSIDIEGSRINDLTVSAPSSLTFTPSFKIKNSSIEGTGSLDGGKLILNTDVGSGINFVLTNGAQVISSSSQKYVNPLPTQTITSSQNLTFDSDVYFANNSGPAIYTLPLASGNDGRKITVKKLSGSAFPIIVDPQAGESIDPSVTFPVAQQYVSLTFCSNGGPTWWVI